MPLTDTAGCNAEPGDKPGKLVDDRGHCTTCWLARPV